MELAIANLDGELTDPMLLGILHANDPALEVELELFDEFDEAWFARPDDALAAIDEVPPRRKNRLLVWLARGLDSLRAVAPFGTSSA